MYDNFEIISKNIKKLREKKGYTQEQLAEAADLSVSHISKVESGQRRIGMKAYLTVLEVLNVNEEDFIALAAAEEQGNEIKKMQEIMQGCSEAERNFLLDTLTSIKQNMKILEKSQKHSMNSSEDKHEEYHRNI